MKGYIISCQRAVGVSRAAMSRTSGQRGPKQHVNKAMKGMSKHFIVQIILWLRNAFDSLVDFLASIYWNPKKEVIPPLDSDSKILLESATSLALKIRKRQLKSEHLVKTCVERIKIVDPIINAVTEGRYDAAIKEAQDVDKLIADGLSEEILAKKPLLGVPFTAKESYAVAGMLHTIGLISRRKKRADTDAEAIKLMKDAGAILVAVSNVPEINRWVETRNMLFGQTNNPYDTGRIVGGSSGGEAALVSSVCSPIGSDIGGSTRMPAYYCGLFGFHPTAETTNMRGATFRTGLEKNTMVTTGAVMKHSEDLTMLFKILTDKKAAQLSLDLPVNLSHLKYYYVDKTGDVMCSDVREEVQDCMTRVIENLRETVAHDEPPVRLEFEGFKYMFKLWRYWMAKEPADFVHLMGDSKYRPNGIFELIKKFFGQSQFSIAGILGILDCQLAPPVKEGWALSVYNKLRKDLLATLKNDGVLIFHSTTQTAPYHFTPILRPYNFGYWCIFNALRFPVVQVPLGLDSEGLPLGIQVVAAPNNDRLCIAVAKHLEEQFGGFVPPCNTI